MLNRQLPGAIRFAMLGVLTFTLACAESNTEPPTGLLTDYASGVDAAFGVQSFALGPTLLIVAPKTGQAVIKKAVGSTPFVVEFNVTGFTIGLNAGKIRCYLDGKPSIFTSYAVNPTTNTIDDLGKLGQKSLVRAPCDFFKRIVDFDHSFDLCVSCCLAGLFVPLKD